MIQIKKILLLIILLSGFSSCVEFFHPNIEDQAKVKYVIDGFITDREGFQTVSISMNSLLEKPNFDPVSFCDVRIIDSNGNVFKLEEVGKSGCYRVWIKKEYLQPGNSYQVKVVTPSNIEFVSDFDKMPECPEVDSVYYIRKDLPTTNPLIFSKGIQFYVDLDGKNTNCDYYRWDLVETWEHHSAIPSSTGKNVCWSTFNVNKIFILSTENLTQKNFQKYPLHFVDNKTPKLNFCYSLLINQYALSKPTYTYWNKLRMNSDDQGGLYNIQPLSIEGNIKCTSNPNLKVLGFFSASPVRSKRLFIQNVVDLEKFEEYCEPDPYTHGYSLGCTECDYISGTTLKPSFWPY